MYHNLSNLYRGVIIVLLTFFMSTISCNTPGENEIWIQDHEFKPQRKTINKDQEITWVNTDNDKHTVVDSGRFNKTLNSGESFSYRYDSTGNYSYRCALHGTTGRLIVE